MPEGDTVWQTAKRLRRLDGQQLAGTDFRIPSLATTGLAGATVLTTAARGKHLLTRFDNGLSLHTHLRMEGGWVVHDIGTRWRRPAHTARVVLRTATLEAIGFDVVLDLLETMHEDEVVGHLGPDLLGDDWDAAEAVRRINSTPDVPVADALLDQRNLAGVGNVYKCELCFLVGVDPRTPVRDVPDIARVVDLAKRMLEANRERVERITTGDRRRGRQTWVYGRHGPCLRCGTRIMRTELGPEGRERITYWCPHCQPPAT
jgi:endonuclease VIII